MKAIYSIKRAFNIFDNTIQGQYIDIIMAQIGREKIQRIYFVNDTKQFDKLTGKVC